MKVSDDGRLTMNEDEWKEFAEATFAPWMPRTPREFDAMIDLGIARHLVENTGGTGGIHAIAADGMRFGANGEINFPPDRLKQAYIRRYGTWPTASQLAEFEAGKTPTPTPPKPLLKIVR